MKKRDKAWLADQIKKAQESLKKYPTWMRKAARWE